MTSNLGGGALAPRSLGFGADGADAAQAADDDTLRRLRAVHAEFRPEFINRLDKIVVFRPLGRDAMRRIARRELGRALEREGLRRRSILLDFGDDVLDLLLEVGFSQEFGARLLQRAIKDQGPGPTGPAHRRGCVSDQSAAAAVRPGWRPGHRHDSAPAANHHQTGESTPDPGAPLDGLVAQVCGGPGRFSQRQSASCSTTSSTRGLCM
jgi:hypothetical protein